MMEKIWEKSRIQVVSNTAEGDVLRQTFGSVVEEASAAALGEFAAAVAELKEGEFDHAVVTDEFKLAEL